VKPNNIYTLNCCTIEVAPGGQWAKATRHDSGASQEFRPLRVDGAPTPQVQATRWAMGLPEWAPQNTVVHLAEAATEEPTELDEATDGE
jgi:hypothetical protein